MPITHRNTYSETLFTLPNSIEDLSITGNTLLVSKAFTGNYAHTLLQTNNIFENATYNIK